MTKDEILGKRPVMCDNKGVTVYVSFSNAMDAMDEYAKQQAIAFFKFCLPGPTDFEPHITSRYDKFIESQNK
jgi:hypothetical protein